MSDRSPNHHRTTRRAIDRATRRAIRRGSRETAWLTGVAAMHGCRY